MEIIVILLCSLVLPLLVIAAMVFLHRYWVKRYHKRDEEMNSLENLVESKDRLIKSLKSKI